MESKEIKVLHIDSEKSWRGGQQQAVYLHEGLLDRGIKSEFICQLNSELSTYFNIHKLPHCEIKIRGELDLYAARQVLNVCKSIEANILHAHSAHALSIGLFAKLFCKSVKLIGVRRVDFSINKNFLSRFKYNSKMIDRHVCISEKIKNVMIADCIEESKLTVIRSGVDLNKFQTRNDKNLRLKLGIPENAFIVGTVASIVGHKDYPNLIGAAKQVCERFPDVFFVAVGDGELRDDMEKLVESKGIRDRFIFAGYRKDVADYYSIFDLFVLASKKEGLGTSILDAMACNIPVVAANAGGISEIVTDDVNGKLVPTKNSSLLAKAIINLIENKDLRKKIVSNAGEKINEYSIEHTIEENIKLYKDLLAD